MPKIATSRSSFCALPKTCRSAALAPRPYQPSLVSVLKDNQRDAGYHQKDGQPHLTAEGGPAENEH
jgi:hypothetical protein